MSTSPKNTTQTKQANPSPLAPVTAQPTAFLAAFFPDENEPIHFRFFKPRGAPDTPNNRAGKLCATGAELADVWPELTELNQTRGVYFVVNAGGDNDASITRFNAVFAEDDTRSLPEQHAALDAAPLPPSIRVETRKSVHAYWLLRNGCTEGDWRAAQLKLIGYFGGDDKIKNPSRVMRVPGFDHVAADGLRKLVECVHFDAACRYGIDEILTAFPSPVPSQNKTAATSATAPTAQAGKSQVATGGFATWDALRAELGRRVMGHESAKQNGHGRWDCRALCHDGKGATGLFYDPANNQVHCNSGCEQAIIFRAFGLPEAPDKPAKTKGATSAAVTDEQAEPAHLAPAPKWQVPKPLPEGLRAVPELPEALIPAPMRPWLVDIAERLQVPLEYPAAASIVALASVIGSQIRLRPKRRDDWAGDSVKSCGKSWLMCSQFASQQVSLGND